MGGGGERVNFRAPSVARWGEWGTLKVRERSRGLAGDSSSYIDVIAVTREEAAQPVATPGGNADSSSYIDVTAVTREAPEGLGAPDAEANEYDALEEIGNRIATLAAHIHAAEHEILTLIADFDRRRGWEVCGYPNCAEWLAARIGLGLNACRERVRVARSLERLPLISAAMARGELSFSKVRELSRIEALADEAAVVEFARSATLEKTREFVRGYRMHSRLDETELARRQHEARSAVAFPNMQGMYELHARFPGDPGALVMRALEQFGHAVHGTSTEVTAKQRFADALTLIFELALAVGPEAVLGQRHADADPAPGPDAREVPVPTESPRLPISGTGPDRYMAFLHVEPATLEWGRESELSHLHDGTRVAPETSRRLTCDCSLVDVAKDEDGQILNVGRRTRKIPARVRRALEVRDRGCRFPGCCRRLTDGHHVVHWADGGATALDNLVLLCRFHHTLVHEGGFSMDMPGPGRVNFYDRRGMPVPAGSISVHLQEQPVQALIRRNQRRGADPGPYTAANRYKHDRLIPWSVVAAAMEAVDPG